MYASAVQASTSRHALEDPAGSAGLRARDLNRLQAELEKDENRRRLQEQQDASIRIKGKRRLSANSAATSHHSYASRPFTLQPGDRQSSNGYLQDYRSQQQHHLAPTRSRRTASNASHTSTILSSGAYPARKASVAGSRKSAQNGQSTPKLPASSLRKLDGIQPHDSPLRRWCRLVEKTSKGSVIRQRSKKWAVAIGLVVWIKWTVGLGGWSGKGHPPLYGDLEAQRNWLSITNHLPVSKWYFHNLQYWGLDYPPLTAYHSLLLGKFAVWTGNTHCAELEGRLGGQEVVHREDKAILFMRSTVIAGDLLFWLLPCALWCSLRLGRWRDTSRESLSSSKRSSRTLMIAFYSIALQPSLILIDSGHFQYNSIMLGLTLLSVLAFHRGRDYLGAILFVCSMCFKQMALYYAPGIFAYLLGKCFWLGGADGLNLFIHLGFISVTALLVCFSPFLYPLSTLQQALYRIFPFQRGLFEDKVANVWCSLNVVVKLRQIFELSTLARLAALATLLTTLPIIAGLVWTSYNLRPTKPSAGVEITDEAGHATPPTVKLLPHALFASAMAFFLFSFQVHEKSILLPLMPLTLLMAGKQPGLPGADYEWAVLLNNVGVFSLYPLLKRDGLALPSLALTLFWNYALGCNPFQYPSSVVKYITLASLVFASSLVILDTITTAPVHLPDLYVVLNVIGSCGVFGIGWLWSLTRLVEESWGLVGLGFSDHSTSTNEAHVRQHFSPVASELSIQSRSPLLGTVQEMGEAGGYQSRDGRASSIASSSRTATRRSRRSPLSSPMDIPTRELSASVESLHQSNPSTTHKRKQSQASLADSNWDAHYLQPRRPGTLSTMVSPSKTHIR